MQLRKRGLHSGPSPGKIQEPVRGWDSHPGHQQHQGWRGQCRGRGSLAAPVGRCVSPLLFTQLKFLRQTAV